jgi:hypothetical protein
MSTIEVLLYGIVGAAAPEVLRIYNLRRRPSSFRWSTKYLLMSLPFYVLGGIFAVALSAAKPWTAIYIGISTPVLINTAVKHAFRVPPQQKTSRHDERNAEILAAPSAWTEFVNSL